jgi:transcriptional regulator with GAF, ATPase, and Fis domain
MSLHEGTLWQSAEFVPQIDEQDDQWIELPRLAEGTAYENGMVVRSAKFRHVLDTVKKLSGYKTTVLIQGESGTGKELVARALHDLSPVAARPFVVFNCSNLVEHLAEAQLFGHVAGAFTDARKDAPGYFRAADGGTLFLDEIGEMPLNLQAKLLRAVENYEIQPVGSTRSFRVDIRLVAATNRDLLAMVKAGTFRNDLYYRLNTISIIVPPLRERRGAIGALAAHLIGQYARKFGKHVQGISADALEALETYDWPGNVRELAHAVENAVLLADDPIIRREALPAHLGEAAMAIKGLPAPLARADDAIEWPVFERAKSSMSLDDLTREALIRSLKHTHGNRQRAAQLLGISRPRLYRMLERYELTNSVEN